MTALLVVSAAGAAAMLLLVPAPSVGSARELVAMGWSPSRIRASTVGFVTGATGAAAIAATSLGGAAAAAAAATVTACWLPWLTAPALRVWVQGTYRPRRDAAMIAWLRRVRMSAAAGEPLAEAAVWAAERVTDPAFAPVAASINHALAAGRDPLAAASRYLVGTPAETLVAAVLTAERTGAAARNLIDSMVAQATASLEDSYRASIDRKSRQVHNAALLAAIMATLVVFTAVAATIPL